MSVESQTGRQILLELLPATQCTSGLHDVYKWTMTSSSAHVAMWSSKFCPTICRLDQWAVFCDNFPMTALQASPRQCHPCFHCEWFLFALVLVACKILYKPVINRQVSNKRTTARENSVHLKANKFNQPRLLKDDFEFRAFTVATLMHQTNPLGIEKILPCVSVN